MQKKENQTKIVFELIFLFLLGAVIYFETIGYVYDDVSPFPGLTLFSLIILSIIFLVSSLFHKWNFYIWIAPAIFLLYNLFFMLMSFSGKTGGARTHQVYLSVWLYVQIACAVYTIGLLGLMIKKGNKK